MKRRAYKRFAFLACGPLLLLVAGLGVLTWRAWQQEKLNQTLIASVRRYDAVATQDLLNRGAEPDASTTNGQAFSLWKVLQDHLRGGTSRPRIGTPVLLLALKNVPSPYDDKAGYTQGVRIVSALLAHGAQVTIHTEDGVDIVNLAVETAYDTQMMRLLLQLRPLLAPPSLEQKNPLNGRTPLMAAAGWGEPEMLTLLLASGAKIDAQGSSGSTALMIAVAKGRDDNVACLLAHHARVRLKDQSGETALSLARANRATKTVTSFTHTAGAEFWPHLVKMLEQADACQRVASPPSSQ